MTTAQRQVHTALEAQRFQAQQAGREQTELDERCLLIAVQVKLAEGRIDEARALVVAWRESKKGN